MNYWVNDSSAWQGWFHYSFIIKVFLYLFFYPQNVREDSLVPPQKPGSCIENALHKDVFGVISGTGDHTWLFFFFTCERVHCRFHPSPDMQQTSVFICVASLQRPLTAPLPTSAHFTTQTPEAPWSPRTLETAFWTRAVTRPTPWRRYTDAWYWTVCWC